jgi:hypothetical protein
MRIPFFQSKQDLRELTDPRLQERRALQYNHRWEAARGLGQAAAIGIVTLGVENLVPSHERITAGIGIFLASVSVVRAGLQLVRAEYHRGRADEMQRQGHYVYLPVDSPLVEQLVDPANADLPGVQRGILVPYEANEAILRLPVPPEAPEA